MHIIYAFSRQRVNYYSILAQSNYYQQAVWPYSRLVCSVHYGFILRALSLHRKELKASKTVLAQPNKWLLS